MGDEQDAIEGFKKALSGKKIPKSTLKTVRRLAKVTQPYNKRMLSRCALVHAREMSAADLGADLASTSTEVGSGLYESWSYTAISTLGSDAAEAAYTGWLAAHALCRCAEVERIEFLGLNPKSVRRGRNYGMARYRGPLSGMPGNRFIWKSKEASLYHERSLAGPLSERARGHKHRWEGFNHKALGWAMKAAIDHGFDVGLPADPLALAELAGKLPMRQNQRMEIVRFEDDGLFTLMTSSTHHTRGPVMACRYLPAARVLRVISPSKQTGGGEWAACNGKLEDGHWQVWQRGNPSKEITGALPENVRSHFVWDKDGCRLAGTSLPPATGLTQAQIRALSDLDQAIPHDHPLNDQARTALEVTNRCLRNLRASAHQGSVTLERKLDRASPPGERPLTEAQIRALSDLDRAIPHDHRFNDQARTALEVANRCLRNVRASAHQGSKTLERKLR